MQYQCIDGRALSSEAEQFHSKNVQKVRHLNDKPYTAFEASIQNMWPEITSGLT